MKRYGQVIKVRPEKLEEYKRLHRKVWPEVLDMIRKACIRNYSIFYRDPHRSLPAACGDGRKGGMVGANGRGFPYRLGAEEALQQTVTARPV
jgi:hypothetical protein